MENVILVDEHDCAIAVEEKLRAHTEGKLHRAFSIFIFDAGGRLLLQKRAAAKYHSGGLWSNSCCGHPRPGESLHQAASRRLREELGICCTLSESFHFLYRTQFSNGLIEHEFDHVMVGHFEAEPEPDPAEVDDYRWVTSSELHDQVLAAPEDFTFWFRLVLTQDGWKHMISRL